MLSYHFVLPSPVLSFIGAVDFIHQSSFHWCRGTLTFSGLILCRLMSWDVNPWCNTQVPYCEEMNSSYRVIGLQRNSWVLNLALPSY